MSRSWERKVKKNLKTVNAQRKKQGLGQYSPGSNEGQKFTGRNYIMPLFLMFMITAYTFLLASTPGFKMDGMYWTTVICYVVLALIFFLRKPYLTVGKDYVQTRRLTGHKQINADGIRRIEVSPRYVMIELTKGRWAFAKATNRYPIEAMSERLRKFAEDNKVNYVSLK